MEHQACRQIDDYLWRIAPRGRMRVPAFIYGDRELLRGMEDKVLEQLCNVASLPGIVAGAYAMPDAHQGYGFPIGGVAAFDPAAGGVVSAGGVGFDISCGVRTLLTGVPAAAVLDCRQELADALLAAVPAGVGSGGGVRLKEAELDALFAGGARWAVAAGYGRRRDLERIEEGGQMTGADPEEVSAQARKRQRDQLGTLGAGNHYLEVQRVEEIYSPESAAVYGLRVGEAVVSIHCGSRGLGHQVGSEFMKRMNRAAATHKLELPDRELACAPLASALGQSYLGAMGAAINCALANRQLITHYIRGVFERFFAGAELPLLYDVSHNTCKEEEHWVEGVLKRLFVHRKGATRALGPGMEGYCADFQAVGQPVLIGGSMGTSSYVLAGAASPGAAAFGSSCHGAGRALSRRQAQKRWRGRQLVDELADRGILIRTPSLRGVAEEAPGAYKDIDAVVAAACGAGLTTRVARLAPLLCVKG
ncbi:MAG: RtcB family protein [Desulfurivibrio sp.]|nr:RtcB family protein [Desulfurivibrio sp.]